MQVFASAHRYDSQRDADAALGIHGTGKGGWGTVCLQRMGERMGRYRRLLLFLRWLSQRNLPTAGLTAGAAGAKDGEMVDGGAEVVIAQQPLA